MIEIIPAFAEPLAKQFDFVTENDVVYLEMQSFTRHGAKSVIKAEGEEASCLLGKFRSFNWATVEDPVPEDVVILAPDDTEIVLKAQTSRSYRELRIGISQSAALRHLLRSAIKNEKQPNQAGADNSDQLR
ncbi:MAG: hypothetical protein R3F07_19720 [Opitutaceae bacterium]